METKDQIAKIINELQKQIELEYKDKIKPLVEKKKEYERLLREHDNDTVIETIDFEKIKTDYRLKADIKENTGGDIRCK